MTHSDDGLTTQLADAALDILREQHRRATGSHRDALARIADELKASGGHGDALWRADNASARAAIEAAPENVREAATATIAAAVADAQRRGWGADAIADECERATRQAAADLCGWESLLDAAHGTIGYPLTNAVTARSGEAA